MKKTIYVNMFGGPGAGKSTTMAGVFAELKRRDIDSEQVTEFAKDLVWEGRDETFKDELYIFAKQAHRIFRINGKVDVVVTDRPLLLTCFYAKNNKLLSDLCFQEFNNYHNLNYLIHRTKKYNPNGRNQTEDEAKSIDVETKKMMLERNVPFKEVEYSEAVNEIVNDVLTELLKIEKDKDDTKYSIDWDVNPIPSVNEEKPLNLDRLQTNIYDDECRLCKMGPFTKECKNCHRLKNMLNDMSFKNVEKDEKI